MIQRRTDAWGRTIFDADGVADMILQGMDVSSIFVEGGPSVDEYNDWCRKFNKTDYLLDTPPEPMVSPEEEHRARTTEWFISDDIKTIDVRGFLLSMCDTVEQKNRVNDEMDLFEARDLTPLLQLMLFLVDHFRQNKVVWGVGRGSSVSSYVLYLIGVHKIDPIKYGLDVREFLKD